MEGMDVKRPTGHFNNPEVIIFQKIRGSDLSVAPIIREEHSYECRLTTFTQLLHLIVRTNLTYLWFTQFKFN